MLEQKTLQNVLHAGNYSGSAGAAACEIIRRCAPLQSCAPGRTVKPPPNKRAFTAKAAKSAKEKKSKIFSIHPDIAERPLRDWCIPPLIGSCFSWRSWRPWRFKVV
ncbi:MAG: hypothetical protein AABZ67_16210 [Pseudomonadota bacterium]